MLGAVAAFGGDVDPRFDGRWAGTEIIDYSDGRFRLSTPVQISAMLGIANSGQTFGIFAGYAPGRYIMSNKSHNDTIFVYSVLRSSRFILSRDGNTINEYGTVSLGTNLGGVGATIRAKFKRIGK